VHVRWAVRRARTLLDGGDASGAVEALDTPPLWALLDPDGLRLLDRALRDANAPRFRRWMVAAALAGLGGGVEGG